MSKPKPGLGKGLARTLVHPVPTAPSAVIHHPIALPPFVSTNTTRVSSLSGPRSSQWPSAVVPNHMALLPLWDAPQTELGRRSYVTAASPLRASVDTATSTPSSSSYSFPQYLPPSLLFDRPRPPFNDVHLPPPPPLPTAAVLRAPSPPHPAKQPRPTQTHTVLSPTPQLNNGPSPSPSPPLTYLGIRPDRVDIHKTAPIPDPNNLTLYSSNLIFHLGASGSAKERFPSPPSRGRSQTPPPPRPRSFPLPEITPPTALHSTAVGEDSYFTRVDGVCVADGVGGWSRSGKGPADAGRWSRLLTHYCEEEVARWWAGADDYMTSDDDASGWAARAWKRGAESEAGGAAASRRHRRPLDPVEIMQKGYEKCLSCAAAEVGLLVRYLCHSLTSALGHLWLVDVLAGSPSPLDSAGRKSRRLQPAGDPQGRGCVPDLGNAARLQLPSAIGNALSR